ncbi:MAG TPA: DUF4261 domain-containing protein [Pyrinomonadaceae bacterium]|nr:DUF4261 domain-containing protein [Pyrinomonadaceae bacterium]
MSIFERLSQKSNHSNDGPLVANPNIEEPLSLQVVFAEAKLPEAQRLLEALTSFHRSMRQARCEMDTDVAQGGNMLGLIGWGKHVIRCVGLELPMPLQVVEACVAPSHYSAELKQRARSHKAHVLLYYVGYDPSPLEQYVALAATAAVMDQLGAIAVFNEAGNTSLPSAALADLVSDGDLENLRTLPIPLLYCGFVKHEVEGVPGVWMRTYGAPLLGLPELAAHATGHHEGQRYFAIFDNTLSYLIESGAHLAAGHTMQIETDEYLRFREPRADEAFLESEGALLVVDIIDSSDINR